MAGTPESQLQFNPLTGEVILPSDLAAGRDGIAVEVSMEAVNCCGGYVAFSVLSITHLGAVGGVAKPHAA